MKKAFYILSILLIFTSCRKDDEQRKPVIEEISLQGKWIPVSLSVIDDRTGLPELDNRLYTACQQNSFIEYKDAGKVHEINYLETFSDCLLNSDTSYNYTWDQKAKTIAHSYTINNFTAEYIIVKLTSQELITKYYFKSDLGGTFHTVYELKTYKRN